MSRSIYKGLLAGSSYVRRQNDRRRREVQLGDVEGLVEEVGRVELVERPSSRLGRELLRGLLRRSRAEIHGRHAGGQTGNTARGRRDSGGGVVGLWCLVASKRGGGWLRHAIRLLRLGAVGSRLSTIGGGRGFWLWVTSVSRGGSSILAAALQLTTYGGIGPRGNLERAGGICALLLLAVIGTVMCAGSRRGGVGLVRVALVGIRGLLFARLLGRVLAVAVVRSGHGELGRMTLLQARIGNGAETGQCSVNNTRQDGRG